jgi:hypothetical protein
MPPCAQPCTPRTCSSAKLAQPDEVVAACRSRVEVVAFAVGDVPGEADEGR